jgi:hypothetical protein
MYHNVPKEPGTSFFSIGVLLAMTTFVAVVFAGWRSYGLSGIAPACAFVAVAWFALSRTSTTALYPMNRQPMTVIEVFTILAICFILHGLTIPAVQSVPHRRRAIPATNVPATHTTESDAGNEDDERLPCALE